jgi:hypothetical protein
MDRQSASNVEKMISAASVRWWRGVAFDVVWDVEVAPGDDA